MLFSHLLLASAVFILGRTVRDTLFLSRYPIRYLPWMFVLYGVVSAITVVVYSRYADRVPRHKLILGSLAIGIVTYLATWSVVRAGQAWIYPAFYVWSEVVANLFIVQFWTLANDMHDARSAKRLFGTIGSARVLGVVIVGLGAGAVVKAIGTPQLIFVLVGLMGMIGVLALLISREGRAEASVRVGAKPRRFGPPPRIITDPYVRSLAVIILLAFVALTVGDYQFKRIARASFAEDNLARFFSLFYAGTGLVSFFFQVFLTPRILARLGVGAGMSVMPTVFGAMSAALLLQPKLALATVMKFADNGLQYTIHETTLQALYVPFAPEVKARTRAFLDAVVKPLSYGVGGVALILLAPAAAAPAASVAQLSWVTVPLVLAWAMMIPVVRRRYLRTMEATLSARGALALDHEYLLDSAGKSVLIATLDHGQPRQVLVALEQLAGERSPEFVDALGRLAEHEDPTVRTAALYQLAHLGAGGNPAAARRALGDPDPAVRAAAAAADSTLAQDEAVDDLAPLLADTEADVRVAALAGLLKDGGVEGGIMGGAELARLMSSAEREDRIAAARTLRHLGPPAYRPLKRLLADRDPAVRRAALKAAPGVADRRLAPMLIAQLADPACRQRAGQALVAIGEDAVGPLVTLLKSPAQARAVDLAVPRILRRIPRIETYQRLKECVDVVDSHVRLRVHAALSHLRKELGERAEPLPWIQRRITAEVVETYGNLAGWEAARALYATDLLDEVFRVRREFAVRRIIRILELRYDPEPLRLVRERIGDPARRANAMEVLDTLLDASLRSMVMPFVDDAPVPDLLFRAGALVPAPEEPLAFMVRHCRHPNPYIALLSLDALTRRGDPACRSEGAALLSHPEAMVREAALWAVATDRPETAAPLVARLMADPDPAVAPLAAWLLARAEGRVPKEDHMYSTVEKLLLLKSAPVFSRVSGEDLAPLARVAAVETFAKGATVFTEGEPGDALYVIVRGKVEIRHSGELIATLGQGEAFGEMAVLDNAQRSAGAVALVDTEALRIGSEEFYEVLHEEVEIAEGVIRMLCARLRDADAQIGRRAAAAG